MNCLNQTKTVELQNHSNNSDLNTTLKVWYLDPRSKLSIDICVLRFFSTKLTIVGEGGCL